MHVAALLVGTRRLWRAWQACGGLRGPVGRHPERTWAGRAASDQGTCQPARRPRTSLGTSPHQCSSGAPSERVILLQADLVRPPFPSLLLQNTNNNNETDQTIPSRVICHSLDCRVSSIDSRTLPLIALPCLQYRSAVNTSARTPGTYPSSP